MKKIIIPGFGGTGREKISRDFKKSLGKDCYIFVPTWKYRALNYWLKEYEDFIRKHKVDNFVVFGFSMGAYILACSDIAGSKNIYGSMTPFFNPLIKTMPKQARKFFGKKRLSQIGVYKEKENSVFIVGEEESPDMHKVVKMFGHKPLIIKGVGHNIEDLSYFDAVIKEIKSV